MEGKTTWLVWVLILAVGGFFAWPLFDRTRSEITVYPLFCTKGRVNGVCTSEEQTANPTTYKTFPDQQSVIYWTGDGAPTRFTSCAVRDVSNWRCSFGKGAEYSMSGGDYAEVVEPPMFSSTTLFYPVSRLRWWVVKIKEMWTGES
jgi:hypothetical protein